MSFFRRMLLPRGLKIRERPIPVDLPDSGEEFIRQLLLIAAEQPRLAKSAANSAMPQRIGDTALAELAIQVWRLRKRVERIDPVERQKERRQFEDSTKRFERILADEDIVIDDPIGKPFVDGWVEIEVVAWDPVDDITERPLFPGPWIKDTVKPIVRRGGRIIGNGQVVVANP
jgi:hypothetical protein